MKSWRGLLRSFQMASSPQKFPTRVKKEEYDLMDSRFTAYQDKIPQESIDVPSSSSSSSEDESLEAEDEDDQSNENASDQLVLYDPLANGTAAIEPVPNPFLSQPHSLQGFMRRNSSSRVLPTVGAFTVQCAKCFKWRLIPTKKKYEEIREHILEQPFYCVTARDWRTDISCDDPTDISQDGSRLWAIDKPNIAQPPAGWQRLLRIRSEGSTKFADIYYEAPSGKRLRSMVEIQNHLLENPEYMRDGITLSQFSFQIPKPLQENYVRKRAPRLMVSHETRPPKPHQVASLALAGPDGCPDLQHNRPGLPPYSKALFSEPLDRPAKKQATGPSQVMYSNK